MTKRGRKLHQTMARRYAIARGEQPDALRTIDFGFLQQTIDAAAKAVYQFGERLAEIAQTWMDTVYPWYLENKEAIDAAITHDPASVQRQILDLYSVDGQKNSEQPGIEREA